MGITLRTAGRKSIDFDMGYGAFYALRTQICEAWAGKAAAEWYSKPSFIDKDANDKFYHELLQAGKISEFGKDYVLPTNMLNRYMIRFLFRSDCEGVISIKEMKIVRMYLRKIEGVSCIHYHEQIGNYRDMFLQLIKDALKHNQPIRYR